MLCVIVDLLVHYAIPKPPGIYRCPGFGITLCLQSAFLQPTFYGFLKVGENLILVGSVLILKSLFFIFYPVIE